MFPCHIPHTLVLSLRITLLWIQNNYTKRSFCKMLCISLKFYEIYSLTLTKVCGYCKRTFTYLLDTHLTFIFRTLAIKNNVAFTQNTRNKNYISFVIHSLHDLQSLVLFWLWLLFYSLEFAYLIQLSTGLTTFHTLSHSMLRTAL